MISHPTWRDLVHAVFDAEKGEDVHAHCDRCASCAEKRRSVVRLRDALLLSGAPAPPAAWIDRTWRRLAAEDVVNTTTSRVAGAVKTFIATLIADSLEPSPALRGTIEADRVRLYEAGPHVLSLGVTPAADGTVTVRGQLLTRHAPVESDTVTVGVGSDTYTASVTAEGEFSLAGLPPGPMELTLRVEGVVIQLRP